MFSKKTLTLVAAGLTAAASLNAGQQIPSYQSFNLSLDPITVSIAQEGATFTAKDQLKIDGNPTDLKDSAIAMAIGYCVFLSLSDVIKDLQDNGADTARLDEIMTGMSINQWMATAFLESNFVKTTAHSGFYQIDNAPSEIAGNMPNNTHYTFLTKLNGGAKYGPGQPITDPNLKTTDNPNGYVYEKDANGNVIMVTGYPPPDYQPALVPKVATMAAVLCEMSEKGFVWESVEKGYYDNVSYTANKTANAQNIPYKDFSLAKWVLDYAVNQQPTQAPFIFKTGPGTTNPIPDSNVFIQPYSALGMIISYLYNRGQMPYASTLPQSTMYVKVLANNEAFETEFNSYPSGEDGVSYGMRYIWQIPWLVTMLNQSKNVYSENISESDVEAVLNVLKGFYNGGDATGDTVVEAGITAARDSKLVWGKSYNSTDTFNSIMAVTKAMLDASVK